MRAASLVRFAIAACSLTVFVLGACDGSNGPTCPTVQTSCNGACVDTKNDPANCGQCGKTCEQASICSQGQCFSLCALTQQACAVGDGGICTNTQTDNQHCGSCTTACKALEVCNAGKCQGGCPNNQIGCIPDAGQPFCANAQTDNANCGACGVACGAQEVCAAGKCASDCTSGQTLCAPDGGAPDAGGPYCASTTSDNANCGSCGNVCDPLQVCAAGKCAATCASNQTECFPDSGVSIDGGLPQPYCADTKNDNENCGSCGAACSGGTPLCSNGTCISPG